MPLQFTKISGPGNEKQTKSSLTKAEVVYTTSKKLVNMDSLEDEFRSLTVSQSKGDELPTSGPPDCNTSGSLSPLDLFIRDLDERKGKLPCCQEVTDIQNSVENVLKALLRMVEKELPFYKTTLINSGSYYEGTKVGKPDEFDYFIQLDNFSDPEDIRFEEQPCSAVLVIPSDSGVKKFRKLNPYCCSFDWKEEVKAPFVETLNSVLFCSEQDLEVHGMKVLRRELKRHGPAYSLELEWNGGKHYKGLKISVDLSIAVKINSRSTTMDVDFESPAGKVLKSLLDSLPFYFAVSAYRNYVVPPSNLFNGFSEWQSNVNWESQNQFSVRSPSDCRLRCSQSCLEQSLFRHFGPDSGPSKCLRVLKVLRDMTHPPGEVLFENYAEMKLDDEKCIREVISEFGVSSAVSPDLWILIADMNSGFIHQEDRESSKLISSYALKTLVLFEWERHPDDDQWVDSNLSQRLLNIVETLLDCLKHTGWMRSFFYKDYNVLPIEGLDAFLPEAINRVTIILKWILAIRNGVHEYSFEDCLQNITKEVTLACRKTKCTDFLLGALLSIFSDQLREAATGSASKKKQTSYDDSCTPSSPSAPSCRRRQTMGLIGGISITCCVIEPRFLSNIYIQALLDEIAPEEELILTGLEEEAESLRGQVARMLLKGIASERMKGLEHLPDYSLWSEEFKLDEMTKLLRFLCENFKKDIEILLSELKYRQVPCISRFFLKI